MLNSSSAPPYIDQVVVSFLSKTLIYTCRTDIPGGYWFRLLRGPPGLPDLWVAMQDSVERKAIED
jgi:hypothetical protein